MLCYVIRTLVVEGLVTTNDRTIIKGTDPKFGLSILGWKPKILQKTDFNVFLNQNLFI